MYIKSFLSFDISTKCKDLCIRLRVFVHERRLQYVCPDNMIRRL